MIKAAVLTVLIETILFFLYGYRQKKFLYVVALANLLTNVSLNLAVFVSALLIARRILPDYVLLIVIAAGEVLAVIVEYIVYKTYLFRDDEIGKIGKIGKVGDTGDAADAGETGDVSGIARGIRSSRQKYRLFFQVLLSNAVSFTAGLLLTHFTG